MRRVSWWWMLLAISIILISPTYAVWDDSTGVIWVSEGEVLSLGEHSIKIIDASIDEGIPFIHIKRLGTAIYKGFIEQNKPVQIEHEILVEYLGPSSKVRYGQQIKLRVYQWVDGRIVNARFPRYLGRENRYRTWLEVENLGPKNAVFTTQLTQEGAYDVRSGRYTLPDGRIQPILLDLAFPLQNAYVPSSTIQRVQYNDVAPNRRQTSLLDDPQVRAGISVEKTASVKFNLYFKNHLLDSVTIPNVGYGRAPSGYIQDIEIPDVLVQNEEHESKAYITFGGPSSVSIDTGKLNLQLLTKGFTIGPSSNKLKKSPELQVSDDLLRKALLLGETDDWRFTFTPHVPAGEYELIWRLWQNRYENIHPEFDVFKKRVTVIGTTHRLINKIIAPPSVMTGKTISVEVRLNNVGLGKLLNVNILAPTLLDSPVKRVLTIPQDSEMTVPFEIPATIAGKAPITVEVYHHKASNNKWNDPYSEAGGLLDTATKTIEVLTGEEGPSLPPLPASELPPQRTSPLSEEAIIPPAHSTPTPMEAITEPPYPETTTPPEEEEPPLTPAPRPWQQPLQSTSRLSPPRVPTDAGMIAIVILIALAILIALRVVWNYHRRAARWQTHETVVRHVRKK